MKKYLRRLTAAVMVVLLCLGTVSTGNRASADDSVDIATAFPDEAFRNYVIQQFDKNTDGKLSKSEIAAAEEINVRNYGIDSLSGIEVFTSLKSLQCNRNYLVTLDLSRNTKLTYLECSFNKLTTLNVGKCPLLDSLYCANNKLTYLDITHNPKLYRLDCSDNYLTELNLSKVPHMTDLYCEYNRLKALDLTVCPELAYFTARGNQLTSINLTKCPNVWCASLDDNQLTSIDLTKNTGLFAITLSNNKIKTIDLSKNPELSGLQIRGNQLSSLDLSANTDLLHMDCGYNQLKTLNVTALEKLMYLYCCGNQLSTLNLGKNTQLAEIDCSTNNLKTLTVPASKNLETVNVMSNPMTNLYVQPVSREFDCYVCDGVKLTMNAESYSATCGSPRWMRQKSNDLYKLYSETSAWKLTVPIKSEMDGDKFQCAYVANDGATQGNTGAVAIHTKPTIADDPVDLVVPLGSKASFSVRAAGKGELTYQWQVQNSKTGEWTDSTAPSAKTADFSFTTQAGHNERSFRCIVTSADGLFERTNTVKLVLAPKITAQPKNAAVPVGDTAKFSVGARGIGAVTYQWQAYNPNTKLWVNSSAASAKTANFSLKVQTGHNNYKFRCVVTHANGEITISNAATLTAKPGITKQPKSTTVKAGSTVHFTIAATGCEPLSYQWQVWDTATKKWKDSLSATAKTADFSFKVQKGHNGKKFRCVVTDVHGKSTPSAEVTLTVQ